MRLGSESGLTPRPRSGRRCPAGRRAEARVPTRPFRGPSGPRGAGTEHGGPLAQGFPPTSHASPPSPPLRAEAASERSMQAAGACAASVGLFPVGNGVGVKRLAGMRGEVAGRTTRWLACLKRASAWPWCTVISGSNGAAATQVPSPRVPPPLPSCRCLVLGHEVAALGTPARGEGREASSRRVQHRSPFASTVVRGAGRRGPRVDCTVNPWAKGLGRRVPAGKPGRGDRPSR